MRSFDLLTKGVMEPFKVDGDVAGNRFAQLYVITGQKIPVDRLAKAENSNGMFADAAGNKVVEVELFERAADGITHVSRGTGRLEKERPAGKLGPGRLEETEIQRLGKPDAHRTGNAHLPGLHGVFHKNSE